MLMSPAIRWRLGKCCTGEESDNQDFQATISVHFCSGLEWRLARVAEILATANRTGIAGGKIGSLLIHNDSQHGTRLRRTGKNCCQQLAASSVRRGASLGMAIGMWPGSRSAHRRRWSLRMAICEFRFRMLAAAELQALAPQYLAVINRYVAEA